MAISKKSMVSGTSKKSTKKPSAKATGPIAASKLKTTWTPGGHGGVGGPGGLGN
jgi:hypothetical protein